MDEAQQFVSARDRADFLADIMMLSAKQHDEDRANEFDVPRSSWLEMAGLFSFTSRRVQTLRNLEGFVEVERQESGLSNVSEETGNFAADSLRGPEGSSSKFQRIPYTSPEVNVPQGLFSSFGLRFRSKVLEQSFKLSGSYSYWIASQKMLIMAILISLLTTERESSNLIEGVPGNSLPDDTYPPMMFKSLSREVHLLSIIYAFLGTFMLTFLKLAGPLWADVGIFVGFIIANSFHFVHNVIRMGAYYEKYKEDTCSGLEGSMTHKGEMGQENSERSIQSLCENSYMLGVDNLNLNGVFASLLIARLMMRRFELRLLACMFTISLFMLLLVGNLFYPRNYLAWGHMWGCCAMLVIYVVSSFEEEYNSRYLYLQQQLAVHKLDQHMKTSKQSQSILNHMIKNVAIGMEDASMSLIDSKKSKELEKDFPNIFNVLHFVKSNCSMVVLSTHFSQMSQDIEEGKYVINVHSLGMGEIVQALLRCSVGVSRSVKVKVVYGAEKVKTPPNLVFELDLDLLTMAVHQVNKIFSPVSHDSDQQLHVMCRDKELVITRRVKWKENPRDIKLICKKLKKVARAVKEMRLLSFSFSSNRESILYEVCYKCTFHEDRMVTCSLPKGLRAVGGDDSLVGRKMLSKLFTELGISDESFITGETISDIMNLEMRCLNEPRPDLVFLDQNIQTKDGRTVFGTDFSRKIREKGYEGFIVIMSANVSADDVALYFDKGDVDCVIGKHMLLDRKKNLVITSFYESKRMAAAKNGDEEDNELYDKG